MFNADLHSHSKFSDGMLAPAEVAARAAAAGVELWSLTDHDELGGQPEARAAAVANGMRYLAGVEISVTWAGRTVHIVGLNVDPDSEILINGLQATRGGRANRAVEIAARLDALGIHGTLEGAQRYVSNPALISRTHFARYLVEAGLATSTSDVFARFLSEGRPGFVPHVWAKLDDAIDWIVEAGGVPVVAHPGRYEFTPTEFDALFTQFKERGGQAIEVVTGSHTPDQYREYAQVARRYGFLASRGSDFHVPGEAPADFGALPPLPADLTPVWQSILA